LDLIKIKKVIDALKNFILMSLMLFNVCNSNDFNREQCMKDWDVWLYPELKRAWDIYRNNSILYQDERDKLNERL
tara:strand:- start:16545 stop:16769 length:225 start_codon:yes stop_codon:yes gene_type:complete